MSRRGFVIKNLKEVEAARKALPPEFRPQKVNGVWRKAKMSAMAIARLRKATILRGEEWKWDIPKKEVVMAVRFKGHRRYLEKQDRAAEIERRMKRMPKLIAEYRNRPPLVKKSETGLEQILRTPRVYDETGGTVMTNVEARLMKRTKKK